MITTVCCRRPPDRAEERRVPRSRAVEIRRGLVEHQYARPMASTAARATRCFSRPREWPDRVPGTVKPTRPRHCRWRLRSARRAAGFSSPKAISSSTVSVQNCASGPGTPVHFCARRCTGCAHHEPGYHHLPRVVALHQMGDQTVQAQRERALARTARPQDQERLSGSHAERESCERGLDAGRIGEGQPGGLDRGGSGKVQILFTLLERSRARKGRLSGRASPRSCDIPPPRRRTDDAEHARQEDLPQV